MTFPFSLPATPEHGAPLPDAVDLIVIGGGVIGICTALYAARAGLKVLILEKGRVAAEQSSRNWGWIRVQGRDMAEIPVARESQRLWQGLDAECQGRLGLRTVGISYLAKTAKDLAAFEAWRDEANPLGAGAQMLSRAETAQITGTPNSDWVGALHTPSDMKAEPWVAVPELARLARDSGALIREGCAVRALDIQGGKVTGVITEAGRIRAERVMLAGGAWSSLFLRRHGVSIPQLSVRSTALATGPLPQVVASAGVDDRIAFRPREDGGYTLAPSAFSELFIGPDAIRHLPVYARLAVSGEFDVRLRAAAPRGYPDAFTTPRRWAEDAPSPFEAMRILTPEPNRKKAADLTRRFAQLYPQVGEIPVQALWAGMIDVLPDVVPVVDHVSALPGLMVCTGMCGHGFGAGPGFGRIMADLASGKDPGIDLTRFRLSRFSDGSRLVPGPNI
ncbi:NAD(P)/FAD-dependent oxidoreductase [Tropicibacter naphthalenivorans]|uniref:N-methyl-L-tryptophan oxidase n=1 Tax=Tropicibacter naphthalenivorans TaxID=441103 RepID=A0A0P1G508_9RHOB|nr:FAD-binding oxidoreductase [Tropicibacter naphthalenivorans]CUH76723.1 N-methyl-L-tryptophan oxidase [Tropicibacter naphthalenivorans]SMC63442.1 Glycine/D-amino acid oxidase [Tropicibacter naphthalenivorans]